MKRITAILAGIALSVLLSATVFAQSGYQVKGVVVDASGPVIGATVMEKGTTRGTTTGLDGDYVLTVSSADAQVEISCIGYKTYTFAAKEVPSTLTIEEDALFLDDVVVIGYGTVKKEDMTGSVVAIKADEINRGAVISPDQMLTGKVAGLLVTPASGQPGSSATIRIRGAASLNASNDPLIVIDGVPITSDGGAGMGNPLASVNPNDIETYSVLKDASATAIYGSRASNGVIIITTKKGSGKGIKVNYDGSFSAKQNYRTLNMMNAEELTNAINTNFGGTTMGDTMLGLMGTADTDWQKEIYRIGIQTDHNISVYGGGKVPFRVSGGYNLDQATLKVGDNQRSNLDVNLSPKFLDDHLTINANVKGVYQHTNWANDGAIGNAISFNPSQPVKDESGEYWNWYSGGTANTMAGINPLSNLYEYKNYNHTYRSIGNFQADYKVHGLEDLRFNVNLGYDVAQTQGEKYNEIGSYSAARESLDIAYQYKNFNANTLLEAYADYNHDFGGSTLDVMGGYSWQHNYVRYKEEQYYNNNAETRFDESNIYFDSPEDAKEYYLVSFFGRVNYSIQSKYLFTATLRDDASSRFSKANRWGLFPSAAFAWNMANEDFIKALGSVSQLKLRLGWGRTGQQDIGSDYYPYLARYTTSTVPNMMYNMGGTNVYTLAPQAYNPNLKWETTETYNVGLDFGFLGDRISGSVEGYYRRTFDLLNLINTPLGSNFSNVVYANIGTMANKGIEVAMNFIPVETSDWHWSLGFNATLQDTKITKLTNADEGYLGVTTGTSMGSNTGYSSLHRVGCTPYTFYLFQQLYDSDGNPIENAFVDRDGDGQITDSDRYVTGCSPTPYLYGGVNTHLTYKNWDFSMNGHFSVGNYAINKVRKGYVSAYTDSYSKGYVNNMSRDYLIDGWKSAMTSYQEYSDMYIENASFFKLDDINLGYTFKPSFLDSGTIRVAGSVQNVFTITKYTGLDPELTSIDGVDSNIIPRPRLYTLRLNINF